MYQLKGLGSLLGILGKTPLQRRKRGRAGSSSASVPTEDDRQMGKSIGPECPICATTFEGVNIDAIEAHVGRLMLF